MTLVPAWYRLELRARTGRFDRALRAEARDALWMLTRQWQIGELQGDDAGSPIAARIRITSTRLRKYRAGDAAGGAVEPFDDDVPLETRVERRRLVSIADMSGVDWRPEPRVGRARGELGVSCQTRTGGISWRSASTRASTSIMLYPPLNRKYRVIEDFAAKVMARL